MSARYPASPAARARRAAAAALALPPGSCLAVLPATPGRAALHHRRPPADELAVAARERGWRVLRTATMPRAEAGRLVSDLPQVCASPTDLPLADASVDGVLGFDALVGAPDLMATLREAGRVTRPGGRFAALEPAVPPDGVRRLVLDLWLAGIAAPRRARRAAGRSEPAPSPSPHAAGVLPDVATLRSLLLDAGFSVVGHHVLAGGFQQLFTATRAGTPFEPGRSQRATSR